MPVANAESARTTGLELQLKGRADEGRLNYGIGYALVDANLTADFFGPPSLGGVAGTFVAPDGAPLPGVAKHSLNFAADYTIPVGSDFILISRIDGFYQSSTQNVLDQTIQQATKFSGFSIWDLTLYACCGRLGCVGVHQEYRELTGNDGSFYSKCFWPESGSGFLWQQRPAVHRAAENDRRRIQLRLLRIVAVGGAQGPAAYCRCGGSGKDEGDKIVTNGPVAPLGCRVDQPRPA